MRIGIITTTFPHYREDSRAPYILEFANEIKNLGCDVSVVTMHNPGTQEYDNWDGIEIFRPRYLPEKLEILQSLGGGLPEVWKKNRLAILAIIPFFFQFCLAILKISKRCELFHANWTLSGMALWITSLIHRKPYIITVHGSDIFVASRIPFIRLLTILSLRKSKKIIAVSKGLAKAVEEMGIDSQKIEIIPDGIDTKKFAPGELKRLPVILFVGALTETKGIKILIEAFSLISKEFPNHLLKIAGEGPLSLELKSRTQELSISNKIEFLGKIDRKQVAYWMSRASLFVLPSLNEGLGVVLLEALSSGTPCVGTSVGGIPDIISPEVGRLVPPKDEKVLAKTIIDLLNDQPLLEKMRISGRERCIQTYDWKIIGIKLMNLYKMVISE